MSLYSVVFRSWKEASNVRKFWSWATIRLRRGDPPDKFDSRMLKLVSTSDISCLSPGDATLFLSRLAESPGDLGVVRLDATNNKRIRRVAPDTLSEAFLRVEHLDLRGSWLTPVQLEDFCESIVDSQVVTLKTVDFGGDIFDDGSGNFVVPPLYGNDLDPELLASAFVKLEDIKIRLYPDVQRVLFSKLGETDDFKLKSLTLYEHSVSSQEDLLLLAQGIVKLETFKIQDLDLSHTSPELIAEALVKLKEVSLGGVSLNKEVLGTLLHKIFQVDHLTLKSLDISGGEFSDIPAALLSGALLRLEHFHSHSLELSPEQIESLLTNIKEAEKMSLKTLKFLCGMFENVSPELLADAVIKMENVDLCDVSAEQIREVFRKLADCEDVKMKKLDVSHLDLTLIPADIFVNVLKKVEEFNLKGSLQSLDQMQKVWEKLISEKDWREKLKRHKLGVEPDDLSGSWRSVAPELLSQAITTFPEVLLSCGMEDKLQAILMTVAEKSNSVSVLTFYGTDLSEVPRHVLCKAVLNVQKVFLQAKVTPGQIRVLFEKLAKRHDGNVKLKNISTDWCNVSHLPPNVLSKASRNIKLDLELNFSFGICCEHHEYRDIEVLFKKLSEHRFPQLKKLVFDYMCDDNQVKAICPKVLAEAFVKAEEVDFNDVDLTKEQIDAILSKIIETEEMTLRRVFIHTDGLDKETLKLAEDKLDRLTIFEHE